MTKVLLVEDELSLAEITADTLGLYDFRVIHAKNAEEGTLLFDKEQPDILIVDIMMPGMDGYRFVKNIRADNKKVPIIFLTAKSQVPDLVKGFDVGANDYIKKPFSYEELIARMKALLKFKAAPLLETGKSQFVIGQYVLDTETQMLQSNINHYQLTFKENEILKQLCIHMYDVVETKQLLLHIWGDDSYFNGRTLSVFMTRIRKYLTDDPQVQILNLRGIGFKLLVKK